MYKLLDYGQKIEHLQNVAVDGSITSKSVPMRGGEAGTNYRSPAIRKGAQGPNTRWFKYDRD